MERGVAGFLLNVYLSSPEIVFLTFKEPKNGIFKILRSPGIYSKE
jgi:hypothetical protein